jgi:magnesium transporter
MADPRDTQATPPDADNAVATSLATLPLDEPARIAAQVEEMPSVEASEVVASLEPDRAAAVAEYLDPVTAARILTEMHAAVAATVIAAMQPPEASMVLTHIDPDDRVDILEHVPQPLHDELVRELEPAEAAEVRQLEQYPPDTAGGIMTTQVTALYEYLSVDDAITLLRKLSQELEQMFYVYVINRAGKLVGVLSMRDLILARPTRVLRDIMIKGVRAVPVTMDQEEVARFMARYRYLAVPVVDADERLVGLITADDVQHVAEEEATEDVQRLFGAGAEERLNSPWQLSFRKRVWWLIVNLATAFLAAGIVGLFEHTIEKLAILAAYMPIIAGMGGNASAQAMAVTVRGLSTGAVDKRVLRHVLIRETIVGVLTGLICGALTFGVAVLFPGNDIGRDRALLLGVVVWSALAINHTLACTTGAAIPFVMKKLGFDPAQSATIFATTVTDVCGFLALLGLASWVLL